MINWAAIKPLIQNQVADIADLDKSAVRWVDEPSGIVNGIYPVVWLRISSVTSIGIEEERRQQVGINEQIVNVCGPREFTLSIRCESFTSDIADPRFAGNIIEKIKTRIMSSSNFELRQNLFAINTRLGVNWFNYVDQGRPINTYICEFLCNTCNNDIDENPTSGDYINEAQITGTVKDTGQQTLGVVSIDAKGS